MKLTNWSYAGYGRVRAYYDEFPFSIVVCRKIRRYYFVQEVRWSEQDRIVSQHDLVRMEQLINDAMDTRQAYDARRSATR